MELRQVRAFLAVADDRHFGRAAARLHIAQPTLSEQLRRLERSVGARLVDRGPRGVRLTAAGAAFEPAARAALDALECAAVDARETAEQSATVRVGFNYPAGSRVLPRLLRLLRTEHPRLRPILSELRSGPQLEAVAEGRLDVGFVFGPPEPRKGAPLAHLRLMRTPLVALVGSSHPLAGRSAVSFTELAGHPCVLFDRTLSPASYDAVTGGARRSGHPLTVVDEIDDPTATAVTIAAGAVVGFASRIRADDQSSTGLHAVLLTDPEPVLDVCAVWSSSPSRSGASRPVESFLRCLARSGPYGPAADVLADVTDLRR